MNTMYEDQQKESIIQLVAFTVESEEYGLEILQVQEVVRLPKITKLPRAPIFIKGVIDLRGNIIPIIDLREKFGLPPHEYIETTRVIIVEVAEKKIGMIVDTVSQVIRIPESSINPPPPIISGSDINNYIQGVVRYNDRLIMMLKVENILTTEEVIQLDQAGLEQIKEVVSK